MPDGRSSKIKACRARIARYEKLIAGFSREAQLVLGDRLLSQAERDRYLAAVKRVACRPFQGQLQFGIRRREDRPHERP
jgi:hypothetical protein